MKQKVPGRVIKVSTSWALVWFSISVEPEAKKHTSALSEHPPPPQSLSVWSAGPCFLSTLLPLKLGVDYSKHSTSLLPLMSVCVPPRLQLI